MFLNQFHAMKMKNEVIESVVNSKPSTWWPESWSWHTFDEDERGDEGYGSLFLALSEGGRWLYRKSYGNPNPYGGIYRVSSGLKWLKPTKGLDLLI